MYFFESPCVLCSGGVTAVSLRRSRALDKPGVQRVWPASPCTTRRRGRKTDTLPVHWRCALPLCRSHAARPPARPAARRRSAPRPVPGERPTGGQYKESARAEQRSVERTIMRAPPANGRWESRPPGQGHAATPQTLAAASRSALCNCPVQLPLPYTPIDYCQLTTANCTANSIAASLHRCTDPRPHAKAPDRRTYVHTAQFTPLVYKRRLYMPQCTAPYTHTRTQPPLLVTRAATPTHHPAAPEHSSVRLLCLFPSRVFPPVSPIYIYARFLSGILFSVGSIASPT